MNQLRDQIGYQLSRDYLSDLEPFDGASDQSATRWDAPQAIVPQRDWGFVKLADIPIDADVLQDTDLFEFQSVLAALATLSSLQRSDGFRLALILDGHAGRFALHLGVARKAAPASGVTQTRSEATLEQVLQQVATVARSHLPGLKTEKLDGNATAAFSERLQRLEYASAITGIPTLRKGAERLMVQTLDRFAGQLRQQRFALVVVADPLSEAQIAQMQRDLMDTVSELHPLVAWSGGSSSGSSESKTEFVKLTTVANTIADASGRLPVYGEKLKGLLKSSDGFAELLSMGAFMGSSALASVGAGKGIQPLSGLNTIASAKLTKNVTSNTGTSETRNYLNRGLKDIVDNLEQHLERLRDGQNLGLWETGVYLLSDSNLTDQLGASLLRSIGSGAKTYLEPVRVHHFAGLRRPQTPLAAIQTLQFPQLAPAFFGLTSEHPLGSAYRRLSTVLNTEELSIWMSLPRRDLPGVSARQRPPPFATDAARPRTQTTIELGQIMDQGETLEARLELDAHTLTRHTFITGTTGSGKSETCRWLLRELRRLQIPFLVIEPAKTEYLDWALEQRSAGREIGAFMPGAATRNGVKLDALRINPFEVPPGYPVQSHLDRLKAIFTASFPMQEVLPILLEAALTKAYARDGWLGDSLPPVGVSFPQLRDLEGAIEQVLDSSGYEQKVRDNLRTALKHRIGSLRLGFKGKLLSTAHSTALFAGEEVTEPEGLSWSQRFGQLFERSAVVNLSMLTDDADKSLVMGLLMGVLYEQRSVQGTYRNENGDGALRHVTFIEEAHRILRRPSNESGNAKGFVSEMFADILAEIRAYGEGLVIVDQVPAKLIPDALKNTNLKIVHRLQARDDQEALATTMGLTPEQTQCISLLEPGQAIVQSGHRALMLRFPSDKDPRRLT